MTPDIGLPRVRHRRTDVIDTVGLQCSVFGGGVSDFFGGQSAISLIFSPERVEVLLLRRSAKKFYGRFAVI